jgi:hypothetical protein
MSFWGTQLGEGQRDPKRKFRFKVTIGAIGDGVIWYLKTTGKPEMTISGDTTHKFMGHSFHFPGSVSWNEIEMTLVDPVDENKKDAAGKLLSIVEAAGYVYPDSKYIQDGQAKAMKTISKAKAVAALKSVVIEQLDADGETIEKWTLHNPFITKVGFGDLSYEAEDLSEISISFKYDWATFNDDADDRPFQNR